jgi:VWFA-related protein
MKPGSAAALLIAVLLLHAAVSPGTTAATPPQQQQQQQEPQRPIFRLGTDVVRVDVYPRSRGKVVEGLLREDFQVFEDGVAQTIETFEFVKFDGWDGDTEALEPRSQREAMRMAADGRNRVFVLYLDTYHVTWEGSVRARGPILEFLRTGLGPRDLFGALTPKQAPELLTLGRLTNDVAMAMTVERTWGQLDTPVLDPDEAMLQACPGSRNGSLLRLWRFDRVLSGLEGLVVHLSSIREERKNVLLISDRWPDVERMRRAPAPAAHAPRLSFAAPGGGQRGRGSFEPSRSGLVGGGVCQAEWNRLSGIDFRRRLHELPALARAANVAFYVLPPGVRNLFNDPAGQFRGLAEDTDGLSIVTNDIQDGLGRVVEHQTGYYMLGYRSTNDAGERRARRIEVKTTRRGVDLELRREYYPPTPEDLAPREPVERTEYARALDGLERIRDTMRLFVHAAWRANEVEVTAEIAPPALARGGWRDGASVEIVLRDAAGAEVARQTGRIEAGRRSVLLPVPVPSGTAVARVGARVTSRAQTISDFVDVARHDGPLFDDPRVTRAGALPAMPFEPAGAWVFDRTDRVRIEWPLRSPVDEHRVRVVNAAGQERPVDVTTRVVAGTASVLRADLRLLSLASADYVIEVTGRGGDRTDRQLLPIRVTR